MSASEPRGPAAAAPRRCAPGELLYRSGMPGMPWRVDSGLLRLDSDSAAEGFAGLAMSGDLLGCETLLLGCYSFTATALTGCCLSAWPQGMAAAPADSLLAQLAQVPRRTAQMVALRGGQAVERVLGLLRLLSDSEGRVVLPPQRVIAEITDLRFETISRSVQQLVARGVLLPMRLQGVRARRSFHLRLPSA